VACDGYGEHADGHVYDGTGIGRGWPLLTGERGHYELAAGNDPLPCTPLLLVPVIAAHPRPGHPRIVYIRRQCWCAAGG